MPEDFPEQTPEISAAERLDRLEQRLARIEAQLGFAVSTAPVAPVPEPAVLRAVPTAAEAVGAADEFELEVGQNWFAVAGIGALTVGGGFMLSLPYARLPAGVPSLFGFGAAVVLFVVAHTGRRSFAYAAACVYGAAMALLYWATLRLLFFGAEPMLNAHALGGGAVLVAASLANLTIAWWRRSAPLMGLALLTACATPVVIGRGGFVVLAVVLLAAVVVAASQQARWPGLVLAGIGLIDATYFTWAIGNPFFGGAYHWADTPWFAPGGLLAAVLILAVAPLLGAAGANDDSVANAGAVLACVLGYGTFLLHTAAAFPAGFVAAHIGASVLLLGVAVAFWLRRQSRVSTFFYAMTGYAALTAGIVGASVVPDVFVWLSLQSIVVVATAIWFRSRFIVVANFLIYVGIVLGYVMLNEHESGISIGFGVVALVSARILNWQRDRLELKTGLMRNAYLLSAFFIFPYALFHLVPGRGVALAWVGLAVVYYGLNLVVRNQKYRWMGHATLLLAACYLVITAVSRFEPVYRVLSFLALGSVLLIVSLVFTRLRKRTPANPETPPG